MNERTFITMYIKNELIKHCL